MQNSKRMDLSAYRGAKKPEPVLTDENASKSAGDGQKAAAEGTSRRSRKPIGRPKKQREEKRDQKITLSLTKAEKASLVEKAGMIPEATFALNKLREGGLFD